MTGIRPQDYFDLTKTDHAELYEGVDKVWEAISRIADHVGRRLLRPGVEGRVMPGAWIADDVQIGRGTVVEHGAMIKGPTIIGRDCEIRAGAYIRGNAIIGNGCVVGNSTEVKNALLHDEVEVPHFAYVGDSLMGWKSHLGAGVKLSNVKLTRGTVVVILDGQRYNTGMRKFAAVIGDQTEIGCNSVLNPGSLIGPRCILYAGTAWRGSLAADRIVKLRQAHYEVQHLESF